MRAPYHLEREFCLHWAVLSISSCPEIDMTEVKYIVKQEYKEPFSLLFKSRIYNATSLVDLIYLASFSYRQGSPVDPSYNVVQLWPCILLSTWRPIVKRGFQQTILMVNPFRRVLGLMYVIKLRICTNTSSMPLSYSMTSLLNSNTKRTPLSRYIWYITSHLTRAILGSLSRKHSQCSHWMFIAPMSILSICMNSLRS